MKAIKHVLFHPVTICFLFCFLIISGESNGAFYLFILVIGLPHGAVHSILGIIGITLMFSSVMIQKKRLVYSFRICGAICFILSLFRFFIQPGADYNYPTFHQTVPLLVLTVFSILLLLFIINQLRLISPKKRNSSVSVL